MRNAGLDEAQAVIKIAGRNINNLRYVDDTNLMAESEEELKSLLMAKSGSWRSFLRGSIPRAGVDLGDPSHRGRKNHMDRSMLCRRP